MEEAETSGSKSRSYTVAKFYNYPSVHSFTLQAFETTIFHNKHHILYIQAVWSLSELRLEVNLSKAMLIGTLHLVFTDGKN